MATSPLAYGGNLLQVLFFSLLGLKLVGKLRFFIYVTPYELFLESMELHFFFFIKSDIFLI